MLEESLPIFLLSRKESFGIHFQKSCHFSLTSAHLQQEGNGVTVLSLQLHITERMEAGAVSQLSPALAWAATPGTTSHLPVAEHQLRAGQPTGPLPDFISKAEAFGHRQHGLDDEHVRPFLHFLLQHSTLSLRQHGVDSACETKTQAHRLGAGPKATVIHTPRKDTVVDWNVLFSTIPIDKTMNT